MADTVNERSDHPINTAGHNSMMSTDGHENAVIDQAGQTDGSQHQQQQQQQQHVETADNNERRRHTAVFVHGPVLTVRDRVFHALFYRLALIYAHAVPHQIRRVIEFALLFEVF